MPTGRPMRATSLAPSGHVPRDPPLGKMGHRARSIRSRTSLPEVTPSDLGIVTWFSLANDSCFPPGRSPNTRGNPRWAYLNPSGWQQRRENIRPRVVRCWPTRAPLYRERPALPADRARGRMAPAVVGRRTTLRGSPNSAAAITGLRSTTKPNSLDGGRRQLQLAQCPPRVLRPARLLKAG